MSAITDFFLGSTRAAVQLELLEITHSSFSKDYRIVRNSRKGITVTLETSEVADFEYLPAKITSSGARNDLDVGIAVSFGDLGEILPKELDRVNAQDNYAEPPICNYRAYNSDDLSAPMIGPYAFEIITLSQDRTGATFNAQAPGLNIAKTGELYRIDRFSMLRGFL